MFGLLSNFTVIKIPPSRMLRNQPTDRNAKDKTIQGKRTTTKLKIFHQQILRPVIKL